MMMFNNLSIWFYLGVVVLIISLICIAKAQNNSKLMENGYFLFILGFIAIASQWADFAAVLFFLLILAVIILLLDCVVLAKLRKFNSTSEAATVLATPHINVDNAIENNNNRANNSTKNINGVPHYVYYAREFLPIILLVFILRAFLFEAYQIPSSSMRPNLTVGDFILVNKFIYGIREPISNKVLIKINEIKRGDVVVFKDPMLPSRDLIKRVIGVGGDVIKYYNKRLTINGVLQQYSEDGNYVYRENIPNMGNVDLDNQQYIENLTGIQHKILILAQLPSVINSQIMQFAEHQDCTYYGNDGFTCIVPQGEYFMMGDNRDNSFDSRYWGFVPNRNLLGRASYVIINFHDLSRIWQKI